jgi:probable HAF family extracellular repeat protein
MIYCNAFVAARTSVLTALLDTTRKSGIFVMLAALWLCASASQSTAQTYTITGLGTLPGSTGTKGYALNDAGEAAGVSNTPSATATMFSAGKATSISTLGGSVSVANAINGSGEIVGWNSFASNPNFDPQAFLYSNGNMLNINSASLFPSGTEAYGINNAGEVVGTGYLSPSNFHAFLYTGGKMTDIGPPGSLQASAVSINNSGQIVGSYYLTSGGAGEFLYSNGKVTTLPVPVGATSVNALAINDNGEIVGEIIPSGHAARYANGAWTDLGAITGALSNVGLGINLSGQVVGTAVFPSTGSYRHPIPGKHVPFISTASGLVNLNTLIPAGTGFTLTDAVAINDSGQILCDATGAGGVEYAVLLSLN